MKTVFLLIFSAITLCGKSQTIQSKLDYCAIFIPDENYKNYCIEDYKAHRKAFIKTEKKLLNDELKIFSHSDLIFDNDPKCSVTKALENKLKPLENIEIQFNGKSIIIDTTFVELGTERMIPYKVKYQKKKKETLMKLTFENVLWTSAGGFHRYDIYLVAKNDQLTVSKIKAFYISKEFDSYGKEKTAVIYPTK
ncbi:hypothetical protein [Capnocytophaga gingivalis]|uniref:hypothetical protein n=1 Tax=Capnocytophaga gingivalis TaxID=1017 RepID=UPI002B487170|nr:hypothetical protein [Capnocytophaga gingivalis]MEB3014722.1 hypothetical protein [Capnocytophaga gingivalis]